MNEDNSLLPMFDFYTRFYAAVAASAANAEYCARVYGRNLCQHGFADLPHLDHLIQVSNITADSRVLDLGCGNGMIAEYIADQTGAHVTGIDFIAQAIQDAQARTQDKRDLLEFLVMDMAHLELPSASFDVVISIDTLYFGDAYTTLQPVIPLLRPGGRIAAFFDQSCPPYTPLEDYSREQILPDGTDLAQALQRLGLPYRTWDYTAQMLAHVRRRKPVLAALRALFEAEENQFLYDSHLGEANGIERAYTNDAGRRHLYLAGAIDDRILFLGGGRAMDPDVIAWLCEGDVSIQYQTYRDLLEQDRPELQRRIATEGWGAAYLAQRNPDGSWGRGFYQPKWTSTHYTLLDLKTLAIAPDHPLIRETLHQAERWKGEDGGINPFRSLRTSDVCVNGMFLNYACYFGVPAELLASVVDFILVQQMADGGFNCNHNQIGARHSSLHSTLSVLEGMLEYTRNGYVYRCAELERVAAESREFILQHRLFKSDHTGAIIRQDFLKFAFPPRWKYNILRALDYFRAADAPWDERMADALAVLLAKRKADGRWLAEAAHPGAVHLVMETPRMAGRWNTLMALRVLKRYGVA